jgi:hypothetical protein
MATGTPTEEQTLAWAATSLRETVGRLALDPEGQLAYLRDLGTYPVTDELGMEFDDAYKLSDQLVAAGRLSPALYADLTKIDQLLSDLSGVEENWLPEALESDPRWAKVREIARSVAPCL